MEDLIHQNTDPNLSFQAALTDLPREHGFEPLQVEGRIPEGLAGCLFRNGPGIFSAQGQKAGHWFDGDGVVSGVRIGPEGAQGAARVVVPPDLARERAAGKPLYAGMGVAGTGWRRFRMAPKNVANTNVLPWNGRLFAQFEAGLPVEVSPDDLTTLGETDLDGLVPMWFSAHHHRVHSRKATYNFGMRIGAVAHLDLFELPDDGPGRRITSVELSGLPFVHDFICTDNHIVLFIPPLRVHLWRQVLGLRTFSENLEWKPALGTEVIVVPIDQPEAVTRFTTEAFYQWHFGNAVEVITDGKTQIEVDLVKYDDADSIGWLNDLYNRRPAGTVKGTLSRMSVDLAARTLTARDLWDRSCEFPIIHPGKTGASADVIWLGSHTDPSGVHPGYSNCLAGVDLQTGQGTLFGDGPGTFPSEPTFVPRPHARSEADGWVLSLMYTALRHRSYLAVWDTRRLTEGPVARAWFDHHIPIPLHGCWLGA
jgi:all-trans-8'-apo-beta-carotenal 15,15'-oxygenase